MIPPTTATVPQRPKTVSRTHVAAVLKEQSDAVAQPLPNDVRLGDLREIIESYNTVTENLQRSHDALRDHVRRLQDELASTDAQLQRSKRLAALGEMAAGIAHEVRNPLGAIQLYAGMLASDLAPSHSEDLDRPALAHAAREIVSAVRGLDAVVCDVLAFARELTLRARPSCVQKILERAVAASRPDIDAAQIRVIGPVGLGVDRCDRQGPVLAMVDSGLLHQALLNLIRNAIESMTGPEFVRSTPPRQRVLTLHCRREDGQAIVVVGDTGSGIAEKDIDRIFNPFFTTRNTGTGLGLAIVHRIVDAHGGSISVHNDGGAVFELRLPVAAQEVGTARDRPGEATDRSQAESAPGKVAPAGIAR